MSIVITSLLVFSTLIYSIYTLFITRGLLAIPGRSLRTDHPAVAVVIAARNEEKNLPQLLSDLVAQKYSGPLDIYIADDRSTDSTWSILDQASKKHTHIHPIRITTTSTQLTPKKNALTECLKRTTAEIVVSTDADCSMGKNWVSSAVSHMTEGVGIVVGYSQVKGHTFFQRYQALDFIGIMVANAGIMTLGPAWSGSGQNLAYRRSAFTDIGGFFSVADKVSGDDVYLVQNIPARTGLKAIFNFDSDHFVETLPMETVAEFLNQRIRWSSNSKGLEKTDPLFFGFLLSAFLTNTMILVSLIFGLMNPLFWMSFILKFLIEGMVLLAGVKRFAYWSHLLVYPVWFLVQPLYISYVGLMGLRGKFNWKR